MGDRGQIHPRLYQYRRDRQKFSFRVYVIAIIFAILTLGQWAGALFVDEVKEILEDNYYISIGALLGALFVITLFVFFEGLRFALPFNWLVSLIIVELVTIGLARIAIVMSLEHLGMSLGVVIVVTVFFIALGIMIRRDLTLDVVIVFVCAIVFFVGSVFFATVAIVADLSYSIMIYFGFVIATVLLFLMYHAQTISGGRYAEMRLNDYLLAALIIYHDFIILYILSMYISTAIAGENTLFNIYDNASCGWGRGDTTTTSTTTKAPPAGRFRAAIEHLFETPQDIPEEIPEEDVPPEPPPTEPPTEPPVFKSNILLNQGYQPPSFDEYQRKYDLAHRGQNDNT